MELSVDRRREMSNRPYDYEVQWLERVGSQYIDTGIKGDLGGTVTTIECYNYQKKCGGIVGASAGDRDYKYSIRGFTTGNIAFQIGLKGSEVSVDEGNHVFTLARTCKVDGNTVFTTTDGFNAGSLTVYLFAQNLSGSAAYTNNIPVRLGKITMVRGNTTLRDFIPVVKDNVGYMFDKISGELFGNKGTGNLGIGPRIQ